MRPAASQVTTQVIAATLRGFVPEDRATILQILELVVTELSEPQQLRALVSAADILASCRGLTRIAVMGELLEQFGVKEVAFACANCGKKFDYEMVCATCAPGEGVVR
jgi:hypothetical protein